MGQVERFKTRFVVKGFMQVEELDFNETFSPTSKPKTKRIMLALVAQADLVLHQMDVKSAFHDSPIAETVYMEQDVQESCDALANEVHRREIPICSRPNRR